MVKVLCMIYKEVQVYIQHIRERYPNILVIVTSSYENIGIDRIMTVLDPGKTAVFVGASGVGKSTLVNKILGEEIMKTSASLPPYLCSK